MDDKRKILSHLIWQKKVNFFEALTCKWNIWILEANELDTFNDEQIAQLYELHQVNNLTCLFFS